MARSFQQGILPTISLSRNCWVSCCWRSYIYISHSRHLSPHPPPPPPMGSPLSLQLANRDTTLTSLYIVIAQTVSTPCDEGLPMNVPTNRTLLSSVQAWKENPVGLLMARVGNLIAAAAHLEDTRAKPTASSCSLASPYVMTRPSVTDCVDSIQRGKIRAQHGAR